MAEITNETELLQERAEFLNALLENLSNGIVACDANGTLTFFNRATREWHGLPQEPLPASRWAEHYDLFAEDGRTLLPPDQVPLNRAFRGEMVHNQRFVIAPKGKPRRICLATGQAVFNSQNKKIGAVVVMSDITNQHHAEAEVRQLASDLDQKVQERTEQLSQALDVQRKTAGELLYIRDALENSLNGFNIVNAEGKFIYVNRAYLKMWGYDSVAQVLETSPADHCLDPSVPEKIISALKAQGECTLEFVAKRKDGTTFDVLMWARQAYDSEGREIYPTSSIDITERKRAESARDQSLKTLAAINEVGQRMTAELDLEKLVQLITDAATKLSGAQFGAFFYNVINERGEAFTLYTISGVPREAFSKFPMPRNTAVFHPTFVGAGTVRSDDILKDGRYGKSAPHHGMPAGHLPVRSYLAVSVVSRSGEVIGGLFFGHSEPGVFTDQAQEIVEGLAAQAAVAVDNARLYRRVQESVKSRDDFLSIASHELKTPLTSLKLQLQMRARALNKGDLDRFSPELLKKMVESDNRQVDRLARLIDDMLDISRINSGKLTLQPEQFDLVALTEDVVERFRQQFESVGAQLTFNKGENVIGTWDRFRIEQVLANLLTNALKYGLHKPVEISLAEEDGKRVRIVVRDHGLGIAKENQKRIFGQFERAVSANEISGLGLGLYIVQQIVEMHGGSIEVESTVNVGSAFVVRLPLETVSP